MRVKIRYHWHRLVNFLNLYVLPGQQKKTSRESAISLLEAVQRLCAQETGAKKRRWRPLRRALPRLVCLIIGLALFLPAHATAGASNTHSAASAQQEHTSQTNQVEPSSSTTVPMSPSVTRVANDNTCPSGDKQIDMLTGLPLSGIDTSGEAACIVNVQTSCASASQDDWLLGLPSKTFSGGLLVATSNSVNGLQTDWQYIMGLALALLVIPFSLAGYQIMLGMTSSRYAGAVESLSRVLLVAFLAVLSYTIIQLVIGLESALATTLRQHIDPANSVAMPSNEWPCYAHQFFGNIFNLSSYTLLNAEKALVGTEYAQKSYNTTLLLVGNITNYVLMLLSILLTVQLLVRLALINFYIILSPLAVVCGSLPGESGQGAARYWIKGLAALIFVQLFQLLTLTVGSQLFPATLISGSGWVSQLFNTLLPSVTMLLTLNIPRLFNASSTTLLSTISSSIGGSMSSIILIIRGF
jgi:hypothetical protein